MKVTCSSLFEKNKAMAAVAQETNLRGSHPPLTFRNSNDSLYYIFRTYVSISECCCTLHLVSKTWRAACERCLHAHRQDRSWLVFSNDVSTQGRHRIPLSLATSRRINAIKDTIDPNCDPCRGWRKHNVHEHLETSLKQTLHELIVTLNVPCVMPVTPGQYTQLDLQSEPILVDGLALNWSARNQWNPALYAGNNEVFNSCFKCGESFESDEDVTVSLKDMFEYFLAQRDDDPLYIFDHLFTERCGFIRNDYQGKDSKSGPEALRGAFFPDDLMSKMSERPPHRWLLIGPQGSGTHIHRDPRGTIAWNALFHGVKIWTFFRPELTAAKVRSGDKYWSREQASSYWFMNYLPGAVRECGVENVKIAIQRPGDVLSVPPSWWHSVVNAEDVIGVTANGVSVDSFCKEMVVAMDNLDGEEVGKESFFRLVMDVFGLLDTTHAQEWVEAIFPALEASKCAEELVDIVKEYIL